MIVFLANSDAGEKGKESQVTHWSFSLIWSPLKLLEQHHSWLRHHRASYSGVSQDVVKRIKRPAKSFLCTTCTKIFSAKDRKTIIYLAIRKVLQISIADMVLKVLSDTCWGIILLSLRRFLSHWIKNRILEHFFSEVGGSLAHATLAAF